MVALLLSGNLCSTRANSLVGAVSVDQACSKDLLERALSEMRAGYLDDGRAILSKISVHNCKLAPVASLILADSYYLSNSSYDLNLAAERYDQWQGMYPNRELTPLVIKRHAECYFRQVKSLRSLDYAYQANRLLTSVKASYGQFTDDPLIDDEILITQEILGDHELKVARSYLQLRQSTIGAKARASEIVQKYRHFSRMDEALWYVGQCDEPDEEDPDPSEAVECYKRIVREYPDSEFRERAIERLKSLGVDIPPADSQLSAKIREEAATTQSVIKNVESLLQRLSSRGVLIDENYKLDDEALRGVLKDAAFNANSTALLVPPMIDDYRPEYGWRSQSDPQTNAGSLF